MRVAAKMEIIFEEYMHLNGQFMYRKDKNENVDACYDFY